MKDDRIMQHKNYFRLSIGIQFLGLFLIVMSDGNRQLQMFALLLITVFYVVFAILHHLHDHDLKSLTVIEYALFGSLGLTFAMFALYFNN